MPATESDLPHRPPAANRAGAGGRGRKNVLDMVRSLAVIGAMVAAVYLLVPRPAGTLVPPVDVQEAAEVAVQSGDVPVLVPELDAGWRVTSARRDRPDGADPATWHVGYLTPEQEYAGLEVAQAATPGWVERVTSNGLRASTQDVAGQDWTIYRTPEGTEPVRTSLLLESEGRVLVVTGSAVLDELVELAAAAEAAPLERP